MVRVAFPIAIEFYNVLLTALIENGLDMEKKENRNAVWDFQIAFSASPAARIQVCPVWLVSNDRMLRRASVRAGAQSVVHSLDEYERRLTNPLSGFGVGTT